MKLQEQPRVWRLLLGLAAGSIILSIIIVLGMFLAGGMVKIQAWYLIQLIPPVLGLIALILVIVNLIARRRLTRSAAAVGALSLAAMALVALPFLPVAFPASLETTEPTATVRLPADAPLKVVWGGDNVANNNHARVPDQRWAYDLLVEPYINGSPELADYGCYGVPVVAPAAGVIIAARDGEPDMIPGAASNNFTAPTGNYVAIKLPTETYLLIAHLKPGSVLVREGDVVVEGQPIGQCGNSGNTSEPHIHIHHQRQDPNEYPINFAEGLPLFFRDHVDQDGNPGPPMPEGGVSEEDGTIIATGPTVRHNDQ